MDIPLRFLEKIVSADALVEVTDSNHQPLLYLPWEQVLRQRVPFKLAVLVIKNHLHQIFLKKKTSTDARKKGTLWGLDITPIFPEEARKDAALRMAPDATGIAHMSVEEDLRLPIPYANHIEMSFFTTWMPGDIPPMPREETPLLLVDTDEIQGLLETMPEALAPEVHILAKAQGICGGGNIYPLPQKYPT